MSKTIILTPTASDLTRAAQSAENLTLAREGKITEKEYERRERELFAQARAESNVAQGLPADYISAGEAEWRRVLAERKRKSARKLLKR
jgi:hypothetical protein